MNYTQLDDDILMHLVAQAQPDALRELYGRYCRLVYSVALHATSDRRQAEEITQDTFMRAWQSARSYDPQHGKLISWLASIARHRAIDLFRQSQSRPADRTSSLDEMLDFETTDEEQNVEGSVELVQLRHRVRSALALLPVEQRQALSLAYFKGLTQEEIAQVLGHPLGTVKTRIRLGMQKLRQELEEDDLG